MAGKKPKADLVERSFALEQGDDTTRGRPRHYGSSDDDYSIQVYGPIGGGQVPVKAVVYFDGGQVVKASKRKTARQKAAEAQQEAKLEAAFNAYLERRGIKLEAVDDDDDDD